MLSISENNRFHLLKTLKNAYQELQRCTVFYLSY